MSHSYLHWRQTFELSMEKEEAELKHKLHNASIIYMYKWTPRVYYGHTSATSSDLCTKASLFPLASITFITYMIFYMYMSTYRRAFGGEGERERD